MRIFFFMGSKSNKILIRGLSVVLLSILLYSGEAMGSINLSLSDAIRMSEEHSYAVASSRYDSLSAANGLGAAKSLRFPNLSLNVVSFYTDELQSIQTPFFDLELGAHENYQADLNLNLPLYAGGRISGQIRMQRDILAAKGYLLEAARNRNCYLTRKSYLNLMLAGTIVRSVESSVTRLRLVNKDIVNLYNQGMADSTDLLEADLALQKILLALEGKKSAVANASITLKRLIGISLNEDVIPTESPEAPEFNQYDKGEELGENPQRAELKSMHSRWQAAKTMAAVSKSDLFPNLGAYFQYSYGKPNRDFINDTWNDYWMAGLNLKWTFNLGGREFRRVSSARESAKSLEMAARDAEESFTIQSDIAFQNLEFAKKAHDVSRREFEIAELQYRKAKAKKEAGTISLNRLLEIESDYTGAEQTYQASIINYYLAETEYLYAIGSPRLYGGI